MITHAVKDYTGRVVFVGTEDACNVWMKKFERSILAPFYVVKK